VHPLDLDDPTVLLDAWHLERQILDDRAEGEARRMLVVGHARFVARDPGLIEWREEGILHHPVGDLPVSATRRIRLDGSTWRVEFADGRPFHDWIPDAEVVHGCEPDVYVGLVSAAGDSDWGMRWAASGPAKSAVIVSRYRRGGAAAG
jgi:hypothetical protein